jgi:hypothetical protein
MSHRRSEVARRCVALAVALLPLSIAVGAEPAVGDRLVVDDRYFEYEYDQVFDYYVIEAWRGLDEPVPAYTPQMVARHTALVGRLPWVSPTASADQNMVLGRTPGWPKNPDWPNDPEIPPQSCSAIRLRIRMLIRTRSKSSWPLRTTRRNSPAAGFWRGW